MEPDRRSILRHEPAADVDRPLQISLGVLLIVKVDWVDTIHFHDVSQLASILGFLFVVQWLLQLLLVEVEAVLEVLIVNPIH